MKKLSEKEDEKLEDIDPEKYSYVHFYKNYNVVVAKVHPSYDLSFNAVDYPYKFLSNLEFVDTGFPDLRSDLWVKGRIVKYMSGHEDDISMFLWKKVKDEFVNDGRIMGVDGVLHDVRFFTGHIKTLLGREKIKSFKDIWDQL